MCRGGGGVRVNPRPIERLRTCLNLSLFIPQSSPPYIIVSGVIYHIFWYITPHHHPGVVSPLPLGGGGIMAVPVPPGWHRYLGASPLLLLLLMDTLSSNLYTGGKEVFQASCSSILLQRVVRSGKGSLPSLSQCLENQSDNRIWTQRVMDFRMHAFNP